MLGVSEVRIFKTKGLARFARREQIADSRLREAIERAERGTIDADLGGGLIKQRVARKGEGRSGGYRTASFTSSSLSLFTKAVGSGRREPSASSAWSCRRRP